MTSVRAALTALITAAVLVVSTVQPAAAVDQLLEISASEVAIPVPAPGASTTRSVDVRSVHEAPVDVVLDVVADPRDPMLSEDSPLTVTVRIDGAEVAAGSVASLLDKRWRIATFVDNGSHDIEIVATMDRDAGNEYAGLSSRALLRFTGQAAEGQDEGSLAITGGAALTSVVVFAVFIIAAGMVVLGIGRRRKTETRERE